MRARLPLLTLALIGALAVGCSRRDRSNPFDLGNPNTGGRPTGFNAIAGYSVVRLSWDQPITPELDGYHLYRRAANEATFTLLYGLLDPPVTQYLDSGTFNGTTYEYRLFYVIRGVETTRPAEDHATPGPLRPWVADLGNGGGGSLVRLSPDARDVALRFTGYQGPTSVAVDPLLDVVWTSDNFASKVHVVDQVLGNGVTILGITDPYTLATDVADHSAWICDTDGGGLSHYFAGGGVASPGRLQPLDHPTGVAVSPVDRSVWVCENGGNRVRRFSSLGVPVATVTVEAPSRVAVDSLTQIGWVTSLDRGQVLRISAGGSVLETLGGFQGPLGLAVDHRRGRIWVTDPVAAQVVALRRDGTVEFRVGGLSEARAVAVDLETGEAWVVARGSGVVARISPAGVVIERLGGFASPYDIAIDPGFN